jgi:hypothetical protein
MKVMVGAHNGAYFHHLTGLYRGKLAWLEGPEDWQTPRWWLPFACDNDAYKAYLRKKKWEPTGWLNMLDKVRASHLRPLWCLVPDVVGDREATKESWKRYSPEVEFVKAFAAQDGMTPDDVPADAAVIFVGGTTTWKWRSLPMWCKHFPRVHVGRVNTLRRLWTCEEYGVESCDGSGWFRGGQCGRRMNGLFQWLNGEKNETPMLGIDPSTQEALR